MHFSLAFEEYLEKTSGKNDNVLLLVTEKAGAKQREKYAHVANNYKDCNGTLIFCDVVPSALSTLASVTTPISNGAVQSETCSS